MRTHKLLMAAILALVLMLGACMPRILIHSGVPDVVVVADTPTATQITPAGADAHFVQLDDYFIMEEDIGNDNPWVYATIGKLRQAASIETDNQARFLRVMDGADVWTRYYAKTRIATSDDIVLGKAIIAFDYQDENGDYRPPLTNQEARSGYWLKARIVDTSEMYRGVVMVSGGLKVKLNALRVAVN